MKIGIATDHNGAKEKIELIKYLQNEGYSVADFSPNNSSDDDYPDFALMVAKSVANKEIDAGILMCGTGIGMSIAANKVKGVRCAKVSSNDEARLAKEHNDANVIALSYKENIEDLKTYIHTFLTTSFSNEERHVRRVSKIIGIENEN